jgi:hypothetical protein
VEDAVATPLSKEEVEQMWEQLLVKERYESIFYHSRSSTPSVSDFAKEKSLSVRETREGYLWGLLGELGGGGGWHIDGQLEAEVQAKEGLLQFYSKGVEHWSPGVVFPVLGIISYPGYDPKHYPIWEFRLILRDAVNRRQIHTLKSIFLQPGDVLPTFDEKGHPIKELVGQRVPRGEMRYDKARNVAVIQILGVHHPVSIDVPLTGSSGSGEGKGK